MPTKKHKPSRAVRRTKSERKAMRQQCVQWFLKGERQRIMLPPDVLVLIEQLRRRFADLGVAIPAPEEENEISQAVDFLIWLGFAMRANEIHIRPEKGGTHVHMHLKGLMRLGTHYDLLTRGVGQHGLFQE